MRRKGSGIRGRGRNMRRKGGEGVGKEELVVDDGVDE